MLVYYFCTVVHPAPTPLLKLPHQWFYPERIEVLQQKKREKETLSDQTDERVVRKPCIGKVSSLLD